MGQMELNTALKGVKEPNKSLFEFIEIIGVGGYGNVWKVKYKKTKQILALKELSKRILLDSNLISSTFKERDILSSLYSPYITNLYCTFQDKYNLYIVLDYLPGKDLREKMRKKKKCDFTENQIKFLSSNIILGLEYIHSEGIIHRDIKPENLVFDSKGYIRIGDFGLSVHNDGKYYAPAGTPGYIAPESIMNKYKFSNTADFFSLGIILYEIIMNKRPFSGNDISSLIDEFNCKTIHLSSKDFNGKYSEKLIDFINKILVIDPKERIGYNNIDEIKNHKFFEGVDWKHLYHKTTRSPFIEDKKEINKKEIISDVINDECISDELQKKFADFTMLHKINFSKPLLYQKHIRNQNSRVSDSNLNSVMKNPKKANYPKLSFNNIPKPLFLEGISFENKNKKYEGRFSQRSNTVIEKLDKIRKELNPIKNQNKKK